MLTFYTNENFTKFFFKNAKSDLLSNLKNFKLIFFLRAIDIFIVSGTTRVILSKNFTQNKLICKWEINILNIISNINDNGFFCS